MRDKMCGVILKDVLSGENIVAFLSNGHWVVTSTINHNLYNIQNHKNWNHKKVHPEKFLFLSMKGF